MVTHSNFLQSFFSVSIAIGFISIFIYYVGLDKLIDPWENFDFHAGFLAIVLVFLSYIARAMRIFDFLQARAIDKLFVCIKLTLNHNVLNNVLPFRSGEVSFPILMARYFNVEPRRSIPALVWFRILDLHALICIALGGVVWSLANAFLSMFFIAVFLPLPWLAVSIRRWISAHPGWDKDTKLGRALTLALEVLPTRFSRTTSIVFWTWANWFIKLAALTWVLMQFSSSNFISALHGVILGDLTSVLPIHSVAGFGTYEAAVAAALIPAGIAASEAIAAAVNVHLFLLSVSLAGGVIASLIPSHPVSGRLPIPGDNN
jgi:glycosyltransferase 2 family protein